MSDKPIKSCIIPMIDERSGKIAFDLIVYGFEAVELMTVPNPVIQSIARRHPGFTSSPFLLYNAPRSHP